MLSTYLSARAELIERGGAAGAGVALCRRLTEALDRDVAGLLPGGGRLALVAVGGYGRGELCLYSDVDLMLLHAGSLPAGAERAFYPLWDAGLKVGHAVRSVREAVQAARENLETLTALLDMRLVAGDGDLFGQLRHELGELLRRGRLDVSGRLAGLEEERRRREPYLLQELNVKEGRGGLRPLHGVHWDRRARALAGRGDGRGFRGPDLPPDPADLTRFAPLTPPPSLAGKGVPRQTGRPAPDDDADQRQALEAKITPGTPSLQGGGGVSEANRVGPDRTYPASSPAGGSLDAARETLLATRNALHAVSAKAFDVYIHDLHPTVANWLGAEPEVWSRRVNLAAHAVDRGVAEYWEQAKPSGAEARPGPRWWGVPRLLGRKSPASGQEGNSHAARSFYAGSVLAIAARAAGREQGPPFDEEQAATIRAAMGPMWTAEDREGLLGLLRAGGRGREVFDALDALGWADRALPEWGRVRGLPQYAPFHLHPVDVHLWRTVDELLAVARRDSPEPPLAGVAAELDSLDDALLAALLHDIGKGWPGDHSTVGAQLARAFCRRAQFGPRTTATVGRAIEQHLLLPTIATRRDLDDPAVIRDVADAVADGRTLRVLYLLSVADARATGPAVWSPWKGSLLRALYERADDELRRRERAVQPPRPPFDPAPLIAATREVAGEAVVRQHLATMPPGYADAWTLAEMAQHVRLMWPAPSGDEVRLEVASGGPADDLTLALEDRPGLLAITSGVLALHNVSVLGGRFATRSDGVALQALHVVDALGRGIDEERWGRVRRDVPRVLRGELDLEAALREKAQANRWQAPSRRRIRPRVVLDARSSDRATLVEVHAEDRVGLLHSVARALFELGLDINVAKVDTLGREVVDVFYVRDLAGHPPREPERLARIEERVLAALEG